MKAEVSMEFRSNRSQSKIAGCAIGFIGVASVLMFVGFVHQGQQTPWILGLAGAVLILISPAAFTYSKVVRIDKRKNLVEHAIQTVYWNKRQKQRVTDFREVGISTAAGGSSRSRRVRIKYFVQLIGSKNLSIPGFSEDLDETLTKARKIAQLVNLPLAEEPKIGFFGKRL